MAKPIKASIIDPATRTASVKYIYQKNMVGPTAFRLGKTDEIYFVDANFAITTITKKLGIPFRYTTYYYKRNVPKPLDWPNIHGAQALIQLKKKDSDTFIQNAAELKNTKDKNTKDLVAIPLTEFVEFKEKSGLVVLAEKPIQVPAFSDWKNSEISSRELGQLLNPAFFAMIARSNKDKRADMQWYVQIGTLCGVGFTVYYLTQSLVINIIKAMQAAGFK